MTTFRNVELQQQHINILIPIKWETPEQCALFFFLLYHILLVKSNKIRSDYFVKRNYGIKTFRF